MYQIEIENFNDPSENPKELLSIMVDVLETINDTDDVPTFNIKLKLINNIEFIIDSMMDNFMHGKNI